MGTIFYSSNIWCENISNSSLHKYTISLISVSIDNLTTPIVCLISGTFQIKFGPKKVYT